MTIELNQIKAAVLAVALANKNPEKNADYLKNLENQINNNGDNLIKASPFYKKKVKSPAGYVIETNKEIMVAYHGTQFGKILGSGGKEILHDIDIRKSKMKFGDEDYQVHSGFQKEYLASKDDMLAKVKEVNADKPLLFSGHSLGGAVAQIAALDAKTNLNKENIQVITFGGPRVFSKDAAQKYKDVGLSSSTLRVKQKLDPVPRLIPKGDFFHAGDKISLDAGTHNIHSGKVYRKMTDNKLNEDVLKISIRSSAYPYAKSRIGSIVAYVKQVLKLTKEAFIKIKNLASSKSFNKNSGQINKSPDTTPAISPKSASLVK